VRILILVNEFPPEKVRGTAMATHGLARALAGRGWDVHVLVTTRRTAPARETVDGMTVWRLAPVPIPWTRTLQRALVILARARAIRPDLVQGQAASCGLFAAVVGRALGIPSVTYLQGGDFWHSGPARRRFEVRPAVRWATRAIAVTDDLAADVAMATGRRPLVIPHGHEREPVTDELAARVRARAGEGRPRVLFVGFLDPDKGARVAVSAVGTLRGGWPAIRLHVVGEGPLRADLEAQVVREGSAGSVVFHGALPHDEVLALMRLADLFVLPSIEAEPFGIVVVEALSEGCPVVVTRVCGTAEIVASAGAGLVVPPGDIAAMAEAIRTILADPARRAAMARAARRAGEDFDWERNVERFERLYREVLDAAP